MPTPSIPPATHLRPSALGGAPVEKTRSDSGGEAGLAVDAAQEQRTSVGALGLGVEDGGDGPGELIVEENSLSRRTRHAVRLLIA
jgi:hypothetical protein